MITDRTRHRLSRGIAASLAFTGLAAGCSPAPAAPPFRPVADVKLLMQAVVDPQADVIWDSVHTVLDTEGTREIRPETAEEWEALAQAAVTLSEAGNLLMMVPRAYDGDEWMAKARQLVDVGSDALTAAQGRNVDGLWSVGERIDLVCESCHQEYAYEDAPRRKR